MQKIILILNLTISPNPSSTVDDRARPEERRRNELYRQYYEELQRRYDTDRPVDCSVIVVNKAQKYVHSLLFKVLAQILDQKCLCKYSTSTWDVFISYRSFLCVCVCVCVCLYLCFKNNCREYAETVGRKVRDLGMVVDLIFLNTEVSLTQALEDVGRARTPFAIIITQQHQVHRSCTVNILFGTPQGNARERYVPVGRWGHSKGKEHSISKAFLSLLFC